MATTAMQVPLGEGYSQMDWIRLKKSAPDLAGKPTRLAFQLLSFPCACCPILDRAPTPCRADTEDDAWAVLNGKVTLHVRDAPGGAHRSRSDNLLLHTAAPLATGLRALLPSCHVPLRGSWLA